MALSVREKPLLRELTTLGLGGTALAEAVVRAESDLDELSGFFARSGGRPFVLGGGSNILALDEDSDLVLVSVRNADLPEAPAGNGATLVRAGAGLPLPRLLKFCEETGLSGLEPLAGIPGRVGGAVAMNAGSYGAEMKDLLARVRLWTPDRGLFWVEARDCVFGYRHFEAPSGIGRHLVWEAEFRLACADPSAVRAKAREIHERKKATQPVNARSAGCVFKNPPGKSAGMLLDQAGFKGRRVGNMAFSELHANFLVNLGGGRSAEALELLDTARATVLDRFGERLETEVIILS
ncbi:MAG: UDP-N-acetylmuramate dehydrogenase [Desulfovibrio aminophilus]|jgi:UDP-N-acetylmuramate dehydrogenase|uniref:UDP-N-acetylmuramate dehydrogenase n=1 Tax=Desulfovibrio aminophilus TaxID=81425 RepID=UPI002A3F57FD|nr:UDP-N-acetylmuramate dehydrogenase [Desulfovibrionaceae bacterium]